MIWTLQLPGRVKYEADEKFQVTDGVMSDTNWRNFYRSWHHLVLWSQQNKVSKIRDTMNFIAHSIIAGNLHEFISSKNP